MSTPPRSPTRSPSSLTRSPSTIRRRSSMNSPPDLPSPSLSARQQPFPPSQPFPRPKARPPSLSSPSSSTHSSSLLQDSSQIHASPSSSRFGYLPPRRPPMNPLVSRLRSTSATPSPSFRGIRSVSQTSSLASLAFNDADELHGFANGSFILGADESFASTNRNGKYPASVSESRRSSSSNLRDIDRGGVRMTPTASSDAQREGDVTNTTLYPPARRKDLAAPPDDIHRLVPPIKWTVLKRLSQRLFSHPSTHGKGSAVVSDPGMPTCFAVSGGLIVVGMSRGWTMIYDYSQSLKAIIGSDEVAKACGKVTSVAISQDTTFIAVAYFSAHIHLYEWAKKPALPARTVTPTTLQAVNAGKAEGHLARDASGRGSEIHHLGFVGRRHTAIVSGDQYGLAFYHSLGKVLGLANTDILRILGKYPLDLASLGTKSANGDISPHSHHPRLLGAQALPLGTEVHFTDDYNLIALLTAGKMVVAGLKPSPRTWWRYVNESGFSGHSKTMSSAGASSTTSDVDEDVPPRRQAKSEAVDGCLAWLPSIDASPPLLAWSWGAEVRIARIEKGRTVEAVGTGKMGNKQSNTLARPARNGVKEPSQAEPAFRLLSKQRTSSKNTRETSSGQLEPVHSGDETIQAMQWLNRHVSCNA